MSDVLGTIGRPRPVTPLGLLAAKLERLDERVGAADDLDPQLKAQLREALELARGLDPYLERSTTPASAALQALARRTQEEDWAAHRGTGLEQEMLSGHVEGQLLKLLVHVTRARRVLELGLFTGYSALAMAEALPDDGELLACEVDGDVAAFAEHCFSASPAGARIAVEVAPALLTLERLAAAGEAFDLIFIDADKPGYVAYLGIVLDAGLLAPNGLICVDNTLMQGQPYLPGEPTPNGRAIAEFNQAVAEDGRVAQVLIPLRDGLTLIYRVP